MTTKEKILKIAKEKEKIYTSDLVKKFSVSRQYLNRLLKSLVETGKLIKIGTTRRTFYIISEHAQKYQETSVSRYTKTFPNVFLEEHKILKQVELKIPLLLKLPGNIRNILAYAFSKMVNNAIEHSQSKNIRIEVTLQGQKLSFIVEDSGIGIFRNIKKKRNLKSEMEAIQDLLKGKTTTVPHSHSGEGIFFTSKVSNLFTLDSFDYQLTIDNELPDIFIQKAPKQKRGTRVIFTLDINSRIHLNDIFKKYTNIDDVNSHDFDKTEIQIRLYTLSDIHISRSQARRVLAGLEKFKLIIFDFDRVLVVGQAFVDEIFRVFHNKHPDIKLQKKNMNEEVKFMTERVSIN